MVPARLPRPHRARAHRPQPVQYAQGTLKSNELYELVRLTAAFGVDGLPDGANLARDADEITNATRVNPVPPPLSSDNHRLADDRARAFSPTSADVPQDVAVRDILGRSCPAARGRPTRLSNERTILRL